MMDDLQCSLYALLMQPPPTEEDAIAAFLLALKKNYAKDHAGVKRGRPNARRP
jgi:hypothetical protein